MSNKQNYPVEQNQRTTMITHIKKNYSERKRKKILPVQATCRNCGAGLYGRYCHSCGQDLFQSTKRTVGSMAYHSVENVLAFDNKLFVTMKYLLFRPGKLTKEYINGKIVRYVHPSKLFWSVSILFFAMLTTILPEEDSDKQQENTQAVSTIAEPETPDDIIQYKITEANKIPTNETTENASKEKDSGKKNKNTNFNNDNDLFQSYKFKNSLMSYAPYASFLLIPFFAFLLNLFFRKKEMFYADHLTFSLHFHTFFFILFLIYMLINKLFPNNDSEIYIFIVIPLIYFAWALRTVYRPKISTLLFKMSAIFIIYGIAIISTILSLFVIAVKLSGIDEYSI